jgi:hypothetical protein
MLTFISSLVVTIILEFLVFWIFIREYPAKIFLYSVLINSFTLPLALYSYYNLIPHLLVVESLVVLSESFLIMLLFEVKYFKALIMSLVANLATAVVGLLFF